MRIKKGLAVIAAIVMTAVLSAGSSLAATSVGIENGVAAVTVNQTVVGFGGHEWWVIGDAKSGVYQQPDSVTLLSKNYDFGDSAFNERDNWGNIPNAYKDSTLQRKMESIANNFSVKEKGKINDRTITSKGEIYPIWGDDVANQKVWALSGDEYIAIGSDNVRSYGKDNWLRSYSPTTLYALFAPEDGHPIINNNFVVNYMAARPALNLNLTSVIFTSDARVASKSSATPGGGLVSVTAPDTTKDGKIKYTFEDDKLKLGNVYVSKIEGNKVTVVYDGATAGKTLSVIAKEKGGPVKFYGKLSAKTAASGEGSFEIPDNFDFSKYDLEVFVEEIGGENESDFACTPKALDMTVKNLVNVNGGKGGGLHAKDSEVTLIADAPAQGKRFVRWDISPAVTLLDGSTSVSGIIKFNMLSEPVAATAVYEDVYTVTVTGGTGGGEYAEDEEVTITADPAPEGKYLKGWNISPEVTFKDGGTVTSGIIKFDMPYSAVTATAEYGSIYPIKDGDNSTWNPGDDGGLTVTSEGEHRKFTGVSVDGAMLDSTHYTAESGSTVVTLKGSYLSTLSVGEHVLRIHFTDGYTETKFSIQAEQTTTVTTADNTPTTTVQPPNPPTEQGGTTSTPTETTVAPEDTSPKTGDGNMIWIIVSLMLGAVVGFMVINVMKRNTENIS